MSSVKTTWKVAGVLHPPDGSPFEGTLTISSERIESVEKGVSQSGPEVLDLRPWSILPGFIDLHVHGAGGWDVADPTPGTAASFARFLAAQGTTAFQASLGAAPVPLLEASIDAISRAAVSPRSGARLLGIHLEGPFLNPLKKGAMPADCLLDPDPALMSRWVGRAAGGLIRQVTIAPELPGALSLIRNLAGDGIIVSGGHTNATYEETIAGIDAGITLSNHTYNAMRDLAHRAPGPIGAYLGDPRVTCELICDGLHVHLGALRLALNAKGPEGVCLISDAVLTSGLLPGEYRILGQTVCVGMDGACRLPNGTLAGSTFHQIDGVKVLVEKLGLSLREASRYAAENPARVAGVGGRKGCLAPGHDADLVVLDEELTVRLTIVEGEIVYRGEDVASLLNPAMQPALRVTAMGDATGLGATATGDAAGLGAATKLRWLDGICR